MNQYKFFNYPNLNDYMGYCHFLFSETLGSFDMKIYLNRSSEDDVNDEIKIVIYHNIDNDNNKLIYEASHSLPMIYELDSFRLWYYDSLDAARQAYDDYIDNNFIYKDNRDTNTLTTVYGADGSQKKIHNSDNFNVLIFTDGACKGNPGTGGYGILIRLPDNHILDFNDAYRHTTNNRMELMAVIQSLLYVDTIISEFYNFTSDHVKYFVKIFTDSEYVCNAINNRWLDKWINNNWLSTKGKQISNIDLWKKLLDTMNELIITHDDIEFFHVKGHSGIYENEECDKLANDAIKNKSIKEMNIDKEYELINPYKAKL